MDNSHSSADFVLQKREGMSVQQLKDFVANDLKDIKSQEQSLVLHIGACEVITRRKTGKGELEDQLATEHGMYCL